MLRQSTRLHLAVAAVALLCGTTSLAQGQGTLAQRLDAAQTQLDADVQTCRPINIGDYTALLAEAGKNVKRAAKATKAGAPVDAMQVDRDLAKASALFNRAQAALVQQCMRAVQQQPATPQPQQSASQLSPFGREMLAAHNAARAQVGAQPVKWNDQLEADATERARQNAQAGTLVHPPKEGRGTVRENILQAPAGYSTAQIMDRWTREREQFVPGIFPNVCNTGDDCSGILHYSQIIWPETTHVGCGKWAGGGYIWVVCRLDPGGNKDGKPVGLPLQIAENETVRPRLVGGDYGGKPAAVGTTVNTTDPNSIGRTAALFDIGIYAGGAWTTDWFNEPLLEDYADQIIGADPVPPPRRHGAWYVGGDFGAMIVEDMDFDFGLVPIISSTSSIALNHDYGYDPALFVGYDLGAFRIEAETAYRKAEQDHPVPDVDTTVGQPTLPKAEVFNANTPKIATSNTQVPSNPPRCDLNSRISDGMGSYDDAAEHYESAKAHGNHGGMVKAKAEMAAGIASHRQLVEDAVAAGEMSALPPRPLVERLEKMLAEYKELTGEPAPAVDGCVPGDSKVEQPDLAGKGDANLSAILSTLLDFGGDEGLGQFVGGGLGSQHIIDWKDFFGIGMPDYSDTTFDKQVVEWPDGYDESFEKTYGFPPPFHGELFDPNAPQPKLEDPL